LSFGFDGAHGSHFQPGRVRRSPGVAKSFTEPIRILLPSLKEADSESKSANRYGFFCGN
jgi:hypothetical protein